LIDSADKQMDKETS